MAYYPLTAVPYALSLSCYLSILEFSGISTVGRGRKFYKAPLTVLSLLLFIISIIITFNINMINGTDIMDGLKDNKFFEKLRHNKKTRIFCEAQKFFDTTEMYRDITAEAEELHGSLDLYWKKTEWEHFKDDINELLSFIWDAVIILIPRNKLPLSLIVLETIMVNLDKLVLTLLTKRYLKNYKQTSYHAYVLYDTENDDLTYWIRDNLLIYLEEQNGLKLYVAFRDSIPGRFHLAQTGRAMQQCHKILILLSNGLVQTDSFHYEMEYVYQNPALGSNLVTTCFIENVTVEPQNSECIQNIKRQTELYDMREYKDWSEEKRRQMWQKITLNLKYPYECNTTFLRN